MAKQRKGKVGKVSGSSIKKASNKCVTQVSADNQIKQHIGAVASLVVLAIALTWNRLNGGNGIEDINLDDAHFLLKKVQKSSSFELRDDHNNRTLIATDFIKSQTVLMEIPRQLMIWDLDAVRNEFIKKELLPTPISGKVARRAALLSSYLALLRNDFISPADDQTLQSQVSIAKALPSYEDYKSFHPVLASVEKLKLLLGAHSPTFTELLLLQQSLNNEYDSLIATSEKFAALVSREDYISCRLATQSRAFQIPGIIPEPEISIAEHEYYSRETGIDFRNDGVVSIEVGNDWMNSHVNNNVKVGGYDAVKRIGQAWATKDIQPGNELINNYGRFDDYVLFGQYGFVPADGTGTTVATVAAYHCIGDTLPDIKAMMPYLQYDYGYSECIGEESASFRLKELKAKYLQQIAIDPSRWTLRLPPRVSSDVTPSSTTILPEEYSVPSFGSEVYGYLETHALSISLPCRLITLTEKDLTNAEDFLMQDIATLEDATSSPLETPRLKLEDLEVSPAWMVRTIHCLLLMANRQKQMYDPIDNKIQEITTLIQAGKTNTLEFNSAQVVAGEVQSQEALESWALDVLQSVYQSNVEGVSPDENIVRSEPCRHSQS